MIIHLGCPLPEHLGATDPDGGPKSCLPLLPPDVTACPKAVRGSSRRLTAAVPTWSCSRWGLPCRRCYQPRGALLPHPFTLTRTAVRAVCSLWHFPWGRPRRTLSGTVIPWSPDFPPLQQPKLPDWGDHPAIWPVHHRRFRAGIKVSLSRCGNNAQRRVERGWMSSDIAVRL